MSTSGSAMVSLLNPLPTSALDTWVGLILLGIAVVVAIVISVLFSIKALKYSESFRNDLANPGFGSQTAAWPASLLIASLALTQAGAEELLPAALSLSLGLVFFSLGLIGTIVTGLGFFSRVIGRSDIPAQAITASWFVPVVPLVLVPSIMVRVGILAPALDPRGLALTGVVGWGIGFGLFMLLAAIIGGRLLTHEPPAPHAVASWWAWLAPIGAGSLGILSLSVLLTDALGWSALGDVAGLIITAMWGFALWWALFAGTIIWRQARAVRFHVGLWGFGFPTAALVSLTLEVGRRWELASIGIFGAILWVAMLAGMAFLGGKTVAGMRSGRIYQRA
jgi:tellurite resistance protein TehA-like permease